jgi:L-malate glycosyltransferase
MRKKVLHVIDSLTRGGAEVLLIGVIQSLPDYEHQVVTLENKIDFSSKELNSVQVTSLGFYGKSQIPAAVFKLRNFIKQYQPDIIHSHLFWSTVIARLARPGKIKFIFTVHSILSLDAFKVNYLSLILEKFTYSKNQILISVSKAVQEDYNKYIGIKGQDYVLHNFIEPAFVQPTYKSFENKKLLRMVAVGNLKAVKNYQFLIDAFKELKGADVSLDIYGEGSLRIELQKEIDEFCLPIRLMGKINRVYEVLPNYDIFVMSSIYEGFGIAPVEAMAAGLPAMLSDIPVLREITNNNAIFFNLNETNVFVQKIKSILDGDTDLDSIAKAGHQYAGTISNKIVYINILKSIYSK